MVMGLRVPIAAWLLASLLSSVETFGNSAGAPERHAFAPFEGSCASVNCHNTYPVNSGQAHLELSVPPDVTSGDTMVVTVRVSSLGATRWGFAVTALSTRGEPLGELVILDSLRTQKSLGVGGRTYVTHTAAGTDAGQADSARGWVFAWVPPPPPYPVRFYAAATAADGDAGPAGDYTLVVEGSNFAGARCPDMLPGDVDLSGTWTSSDIIILVNFVFKGGAPPLPEACNGDVNCSGSVTSADIIYLLHTVFKNGIAPCDICNDPGAQPCLL